MAGELGFEPRLAESESAVLPLDDSPSRRLDVYSTTRQPHARGILFNIYTEVAG
jgi:hypothetical protein